MEFEDQTYQNIQNYLKGKLLDSEQSAFESELEKNTQLQNAVNAEKLLAKLIEDKELLDYKNMLGNLHRNEVKKTSIKKILIPSAASLFIIGSAVWYVGYPKNNQEVANQKDKGVISFTESTKKIDTIAVDKTIASKNDKNVDVVTKVKETKPSVVVNDKIKDKTSSEIIVLEEEMNKVSKEQQVNKLVPAATTSTKPTEKTVEKLVDNICNNVRITLDYQVDNTCKNESNGGLIIEKISGGQKPYSMVILNKENQIKQINNQLEVGEYVVYVNDANNCFSNKYNVLVKEKDCIKNVHLNTSISEMFSIPNENKACFLKIVDKAGNVYFSKNLQNGELYDWDGRANEGHVKAGFYLYQLTFNDGSVTKGTITISE